MDKGELPLGFCFALAQDPGAMKKFSDLSEEQKTEILRKAHEVSSKDEMQALVRDLIAK